MALMEAPTLVGTWQPLVLRRAEVTEAEHLILLVVWEQYRRRGGVTYRRLRDMTGFSIGKLHVWLDMRRNNLRSRGLVVERLYPEGRRRWAMLRPGPRLAMYHGQPYELVETRFL